VPGKGPPPEAALIEENKILTQKLADEKKDRAEEQAKANDLRQRIDDTWDDLKKANSANHELRNENEKLEIENKTMDLPVE
jgi:hypothetical protein